MQSWDLYLTSSIRPDSWMYTFARALKDMCARSGRSRRIAAASTTMRSTNGPIRAVRFLMYVMPPTFPPLSAATSTSAATARRTSRARRRTASSASESPPPPPAEELVGVETEPGNRCSRRGAREAPSAARRAAEGTGAGGGRTGSAAVVGFWRREAATMEGRRRRLRRWDGGLGVWSGRWRRRWECGRAAAIGVEWKVGAPIRFGWVVSASRGNDFLVNELLLPAKFSYFKRARKKIIGTTTPIF